MKMQSPVDGTKAKNHNDGLNKAGLSWWRKIIQNSANGTLADTIANTELTIPDLRVQLSPVHDYQVLENWGHKFQS